MQKRVFLLLAVVLLFLGSRLSGVQNIVQLLTTPLQRATKAVFNLSLGGSSDIQKLQNENNFLRKKLVDEKKLEEDIQALRDQFEAANPNKLNLLPATVVGSPGFVPGITAPDFLILDKGSTDNIKTGQAVVFKDNAVGKIIQVSPRLSIVRLITNKQSLATANTIEKGSLGVVKGQGNGEMILDNVLLSDILSNHDSVVTKGDIDQKGLGFPPNLIIGKIVSVDKKASSLFQRAEVATPLDFSKLSTVFIIVSE